MAPLDAVKLTTLGRQALANHKVNTAVTLLSAASTKAPQVPEIWYYLATALGRKGGQDATCCLCYLRAVQLLQQRQLQQPQHTQQPQNKALPAQSLAAAAADNCWLLANQLLPTAWSAAMKDQHMQQQFDTAAHVLLMHMFEEQAAAAAAPAATADDSSRSSSSAAAAAAGSTEDAQACSAAGHIQLVCVGGLGVHALQLAAAASDVQSLYVQQQQQQQQCHQSGRMQHQQQPCGEIGVTVQSIGMVFVPADGLTAHLAQQLFVDNELDDIIDVATWSELKQQHQEQQQLQQREDGVIAVGSSMQSQQMLAVLAGCIQPNWDTAAAGVVSACKHLAQICSSSSVSTGSDSNKNCASFGNLQQHSTHSMQPCSACPGRVKVWAMPVSCQDLLNLNEVDVQAIAQHTAGSYDYSAANAVLRRSSRPSQISRFEPVVLAQPAVVCELNVQQLLMQCWQQQQQQHNPPSKQQQEDAADTATALCLGHAALSSTTVTVEVSGRLDCIVWWLEFELAPGCCVSFAPAAAAAASAVTGDNRVDNLSTGDHGACTYHQQQQQQSSQPSSSSSNMTGPASTLPGVLQPHIWQHVEYLPKDQQGQAHSSACNQQQQQQQNDVLQPLHQGQQVSAGQQLLLQVTASADSLSMQLFSSSPFTYNLKQGVHQPTGCGCKQLQQQWQEASKQMEKQGRQILPYHMSMLNDHKRTMAYDKGIRGVVNELLSKPQQQQQSTNILQQQQQTRRNSKANQPNGAAMGSKGQPDLIVLDVGCGTGLLSMMAANAAAAASGNGSAAAGDEAAAERDSGQLSTATTIGCEREPVLASVAQQLLAANNLDKQVTVVQKLSSQLKISSAQQSSSSTSRKASSGKGNKRIAAAHCQVTDASGTAAPEAQSAGQYDLPAPAGLIVHEIFGTDPFSEHVLPALRHVQQHLAAPGARFMPRAVQVIAAVALCPALQQRLRLQETAAPANIAAGNDHAGGVSTLQQQQQQISVNDHSNSVSLDASWNLSSLLLLQPRKLELQLDELADQLIMLTQPTAVLEVEFDKQWPLDLNGQVIVSLPSLQQGLLLQHWMEQQQVQIAQYSGLCGNDKAPKAAAAAASVSAAAEGLARMSVSNTYRQPMHCDELCVVSWFEADCGEGGCLTTAPGHTWYGHWQQSLEFVKARNVAAAAAVADTLGSQFGAAADMASSSMAYKLSVTWAVDRVKFGLLP